ncbi:hypothetical protein ACFQ2K_23095 [Streptomyces sanglieri]|uniref:Uncharacterized protein n=1 Tax=Streptomyces sanglieri TaxID=193460 RepID=A0ABW2WX38_9ACTN
MLRATGAGSCPAGAHVRGRRGRLPGTPWAEVGAEAGAEAGAWT